MVIRLHTASLCTAVRQVLRLSPPALTALLRRRDLAGRRPQDERARSES